MDFSRSIQFVYESVETFFCFLGWCLKHQFGYFVLLIGIVSTFHGTGDIRIFWNKKTLGRQPDKVKIFFVEDFVAEPDMALRGDNFGVFFFFFFAAGKWMVLILKLWVSKFIEAFEIKRIFYFFLSSQDVSFWGPVINFCFGENWWYEVCLRGQFFVMKFLLFFFTQEDIQRWLTSDIVWKAGI